MHRVLGQGGSPPGAPPLKPSLFTPIALPKSMPCPRSFELIPSYLINDHTWWNNKLGSGWMESNSVIVKEWSKTDPRGKAFYCTLCSAWWAETHQISQKHQNNLWYIPSTVCPKPEESKPGVKEIKPGAMTPKPPPPALPPSTPPAPALPKGSKQAPPTLPGPPGLADLPHSLSESAACSRN